jgi:hypothetical protein
MCSRQVCTRTTRVFCERNIDSHLFMLRQLRQRDQPCSHLLIEHCQVILHVGRLGQHLRQCAAAIQQPVFVLWLLCHDVSSCYGVCRSLHAASCQQAYQQYTTCNT